jgi:integrase
VRLPRVDQPERRFLSTDELTALETAMDPHWALIVPFAAATGLRIGELAALTVRDLELDAGQVRVRHTAIEINGRRSVSSPKSRAGVRTVPTVYPALAERAREHVESRGLSADDWLFGGPKGAALRLSDWRHRVWKPAVSAARLRYPQPTPHPLRHTAIAAWLAAGVPVVRAAA